MQSAVFVGSHPPSKGTFDWVVEPSARVGLGGGASLPDIAVVKGLLTRAVPVIDELTAGDDEALLRDEMFQLVLATARVEAVARELADGGGHLVVGEQRLPRPSRPARIAEGLARFTGSRIEWSGQRALRRFPAGMVGSWRAWKWSRGAEFATVPVIAAVGGPSERRALEPVCRHLDGAQMVDFGIDVDRELPSFGSLLTVRDAVRRLDHRGFAARSAEIWGSHDWWGARWIPWVESSLSVMGRITLREALLFREAGRRALADSSLLLTAKVRFARARALVAAAEDLGVDSFAIQHGMYVDGNEWTDLRPRVFGVSGGDFAGILERRGFPGEIVSVGAPFYEVPDRSWECGIALQPAEGIVVASPADYERHARIAYETARRVLGGDAVIGFRLHPREDERRLRRIVGDGPPLSRDPGVGGGMWITIESSFVVQAALSGASTVLINFNEHPWEYPFAEMPGIQVARDAGELEAALRGMVADPSPMPAEEWARQFAVATGEEAATAVAAIVQERLRR